MELVKNILRMECILKVNLKKDKDVEKEYLLFKMDPYIKVNLKTMLLMDLEHIIIQIVNNIKVKYYRFIVILRLLVK